ncbi:hypothetical protein T440DRAFT_536446 [Plenodomus tracheiphilus IPT5]|uniref:Uncharacterized protein n=1 Tax=Plenodomus tracheiphilus IPT5 TaxID=1408161 RepID=A0A6A7AZQ8_9PLEO|nr:hypothetical protein T440DRAFT_536446 [Plenodomus tracheiphilus IPT5]
MPRVNVKEAKGGSNDAAETSTERGSTHPRILARTHGWRLVKDQDKYRVVSKKTCTREEIRISKGVPCFTPPEYTIHLKNAGYGDIVYGTVLTYSGSKLLFVYRFRAEESFEWLTEKEFKSVLSEKDAERFKTAVESSADGKPVPIVQEEMEDQVSHPTEARQSDYEMSLQHHAEFLRKLFDLSSKYLEIVPPHLTPAIAESLKQCFKNLRQTVDIGEFAWKAQVDSAASSGNSAPTT